MNMQFIIEPAYQNSFWCLKTLKGLKNQASLRKIQLMPLKESSLLQMAPTQKNTVIMILGTSINWIRHIVALSSKMGYVCLLVTGDQLPETADRVSSVLIDYQSGMYALLSHLKSMGDEKIALLGINPNSYADSIKSQCFPQKEDIYYNYGSITTCVDQLWSNISSYDAVICSNHAVAVYLHHFLQIHGIDLKDDLHLATFGDSILSDLMDPPITSIVQDYQELGAQAINAYSFLTKNPTPIINILIKGSLKTNGTTVSLNSPPISSADYAPDVNFYNDTCMSSILSLERLLSDANSLDIIILKKILEKETQEQIAEELHLALSSLRYHIKKMRSFFPGLPNTELVEVAAQYLTPDAFSKAAELKKKQ